MIIAGSYEGGLHGWSVPKRQDDASSLLFSFVAHTGCVRSVAVHKGKKLLISGGDDEVIKVFSLKTMKQIGEAEMQRGTITSLAFCGMHHALSGSSDGTICVWRIKDWQCVHVLGGHKSTVLDVASHPSGKMALSTGADRTLRLWDLTKGRCAFITRTKGAGQLVRWSPDGKHYLAAVGGRLQIRDVEETAPIFIDHDSVLLDALFVQDALVATASAAGQLALWNWTNSQIVWTRRRHDAGRVKALALLPSKPYRNSWKDEKDEEKEIVLAVSVLAATSDGTVETWRLRDDIHSSGQDGPDSKVSVGTRLTCLDLLVDDAPIDCENEPPSDTRDEQTATEKTTENDEATQPKKRQMPKQQQLKDKLREKKKRRRKSS